MRAAVIAAALACASSAAAQPSKAKAEAELAAGEKLYAAGAYVEAAARFEAAYALDPDPAYLYNIAQAYRFGNVCAKAAAAYRAFLDVVPAVPNAAKVRQLVDQTDECAKQQASVREATPPATGPAVEPAAVPLPPEEPRQASRPGRGQRIAGIAIGGAGVVGLGLAAFFTYRASDYTSQREGLCAAELETAGTCMWTEERERRENELNDLGDRAQLLARISWGLGGAALVGGVVLYLLAPRAASERAAVTVVPSQGGAMAFGTLRF